MKCFFTYIIYTLSALTVVRSNNEDAKTQLNKFLDQIQSYSGITNRRIKIDLQDSSLYHFFRPLGNAKLTITNQDVNITAYVLHTVVSCEYSENAYYFVKLIDNKIKKITNANGREVVRFIRSDILIKIKQILQSMIFTLIGLLKYLRNEIFKQDEMLTILLSWYIFIDNYLVKKDEDLKHIESIKLTNYQVEKYLKQYNLSNDCKKIKEFEDFKITVDRSTNTLIESNNFRNEFITKLRNFEPLLYEKFLENESNKFILASDQTVSGSLKNLLDKQMKSGVLKILFDGYDHKDLLWSLVDQTTNITSLLNYEKLVISAITKIIISYVWNVLKAIVKNTDVSDVKGPCNRMLTSKLMNYEEKLKSKGQPRLLLNNLSIIKTDLLALCNNDVDVKRHISEIEPLKIDIRSDALSDQFEEFLKSLTDLVICTKLHPLLSNVYWEKLYFAHTNINKYIFDSKHLLLDYHEFPEVCSKMSLALTDLSNIIDLVNQCEDKNNHSNHGQINKCINNVNSSYYKFMIKIEDLTIQTNEINNYTLKKMLLRLNYKFSDGTQLINTENTEKCNRSLQIFKIFLNRVNDEIDIEYELTCRTKTPSSNSSNSTTTPSSNSSNSTTTPSSSLIRSATTSLAKFSQTGLAFLRNPKKREVYIDGTNIKIIELKYCRNFLITMYLFGMAIAINSGPLDQSIKLYMNGTEMTFINFRTLYNAYSIDFMQDIYEYYRFLVRWIIAQLYTKIYEILVDISENSDTTELCKHETYEYLMTITSPIKNFPLYIALPVNKIINTFLMYVNYCNGRNNKHLIIYRTKLVQEIENLGVPQTCFKSNLNKSFADRIQAFDNIIFHLRGIYETTYKFNMEKYTADIQIRQLDVTNMFENWRL